MLSSAESIQCISQPSDIRSERPKPQGQSRLPTASQMWRGRLATQKVGTANFEPSGQEEEEEKEG
jgi:hypothetical protein